MQSIILVEAEVPRPESSRMSSQRHLDHPEDLMIRKGERGFEDMINVLSRTYDFVKGRGRKDFNISTKFDGSAGILWGYQDKKFFVATKSFFNKNPKLNFTPKDVDENHKNSKSLQDKLKLLLKKLPDITPKRGIYRGDLMFTNGDISQSKGMVTFTPNTITYNIPDTSPEGEKMLKAKLGIAPHMHYEKLPSGDLKGVYDNKISGFKKNDDIYLFDPQVEGPFDFPPEAEKDFAATLTKAKKLQPQLAKLRAFNAVSDHEATLMTYINSCIKEKRDTSTAGYIAYLNKSFGKHMDTVKQEKSKERIKKNLDDEIFKINQNKEAINLLFQAHGEIQKAKKILVSVLSKNSPYGETILGKKSKPEGFVVSVHGQPVKLVDRKEFSAANFDFNMKVDPEDNPLVLTWGRMNPATAGHEKVVRKADDVARRIGAKQKIVLSRTQGDKKNPLTPAEKLKWAKHLFPGKDVSLAGENDGTLIAQLQHAYNSGVRDLTMVAGSDKVDTYARILNKYNGEGDGKLFNFKRVRVVNAGGRDKDSASVAGISSTKVRDAASSNNYRQFAQMLPKNTSRDSRKDLFHTLRANQGMVKIGPDTDGHALSIYIKRDDAIGKDAHKEIERRKKTKTWKGK